MDVDEAGCDREALGVDYTPGPRFIQTIERCHTAVGDADIEALARRASAVDDIAAPDEDVEVHWLGVEVFASGQKLPTRIMRATSNGTAETTILCSGRRGAAS